jgi:hypothetical protein
MIAETAYGIRPQGHCGTVHRDRIIPEDRLKELCWPVRGWLGDASFMTHNAIVENFKSACDVIAKYNILPEEAEYLSLDEYIEDHYNYRTIGAFITAAHQHAGSEVFTYMHDTPLVNHLGYGYAGIIINKGRIGGAAGKKASGVFINIGTVGARLGDLADGVIINAGVARGFVGTRCKGILVNMGTTGKQFAYDSTAQIIICKEPQRYGSIPRHHSFIRPTVELEEYLNEIVQLARHAPEDVLHRFGDAAAIRAAIEEMIR